ncbi:MAG: hypothetical protein ACREOJ_20990 [Gemmatimonadaceae bacterium]
MTTSARDSARVTGTRHEGRQLPAWQVIRLSGAVGRSAGESSSAADAAPTTFETSRSGDEAEGNPGKKQSDNEGT